MLVWGVIRFLYHYSKTEYFISLHAALTLSYSIYYDIASAYVSRGGSLRDRGSMPGVVPGALGRLGSWIAVVEPGGA